MVVFVMLLPQLVGIFLVIWLAYTILRVFGVIRREKQPQQNQQYTQYTNNQSNSQYQNQSTQRPKGDVIDVEFTEHEVDDKN